MGRCPASPGWLRAHRRGAPPRRRSRSRSAAGDAASGVTSRRRSTSMRSAPRRPSGAGRLAPRRHPPAHDDARTRAPRTRTGRRRARRPTTRSARRRTSTARARAAPTRRSAGAIARRRGARVRAVKGSATPGMRMVEIRGRTVPAPAVPRPLEADRRRPPRRAVERVGGRPDRVAMWALLMGLLLILVAIGTADARPSSRSRCADRAQARARARSRVKPRGWREAFADPSHLDEPRLSARPYKSSGALVCAQGAAYTYLK